MRIATVEDSDLEDLLPLMRAYCDFYGVDQSDSNLAAVSRSLLAEPDCEGFQILARDEAGRALGFATVYWSWSTLSASRIAVMNDLFVHPSARGKGLAEALIVECRERARRRGATSLRWQTAKDNLRAQKVYERTGALAEEWRDYILET